jgi:hypothetical protein
VNTLKEMDAEHGYWIKTVIRDQGSGIRDQSAEDEDEAVATLRVVGEKLAEDQPLELDAGWNLVSYLPRQSLAVQDALQRINGQYTAVLGYDQGALSYYPDIDPSFNTLRTLEPLHGYWIKMAQAGTLQYSAAGGGQVSGKEQSGFPGSTIQSPIRNIRQAEQVAGATPAPTWVNFYGTAYLPDGTPLPVGTTVLAVDPNGVVCGATPVTQAGQYGLLACYGDDPMTPEDEGAQPGDTVRLIVDGQVLGTAVWTAHGERQWVALGATSVWKVWVPFVHR